MKRKRDVEIKEVDVKRRKELVVEAKRKEELEVKSLKSRNMKLDGVVGMTGVVSNDKIEFIIVEEDNEIIVVKDPLLSTTITTVSQNQIDEPKKVTTGPISPVKSKNWSERVIQSATAIVSNFYGSPTTADADVEAGGSSSGGEVVGEKRRGDEEVSFLDKLFWKRQKKAVEGEAVLEEMNDVEADDSDPKKAAEESVAAPVKKKGADEVAAEEEAIVAPLEIKHQEEDARFEKKKWVLDEAIPTSPDTDAKGDVALQAAAVSDKDREKAWKFLNDDNNWILEPYDFSILNTEDYFDDIHFVDDTLPNHEIEVPTSISDVGENEKDTEDIESLDFGDLPKSSQDEKVDTDLEEEKLLENSLPPSLDQCESTANIQQRSDNHFENSLPTSLDQCEYTTSIQQRSDNRSHSRSLSNSTANDYSTRSVTPEVGGQSTSSVNRKNKQKVLIRIPKSSTTSSIKAKPEITGPLKDKNYEMSSPHQDGCVLIPKSSTPSTVNFAKPEISRPFNGNPYELSTLGKNYEISAPHREEWAEILNKYTGNGKIYIQNDVDSDGPPKNFEYINDLCYTEGTPGPADPDFLLGCKHDKKDVICDANCGCLQDIDGGSHPFVYYHNDKLGTSGTIYECNVKCQCDINCGNRASQRPGSIDFTIFKDKKRGWGVKAATIIAKNQFIGEYFGEVFSEEAMSKLTDREERYVFNLDLEDGEVEYCIDGLKKGNLSRFFNHCCDEKKNNIKLYPLFSDHAEGSMYRLAFFATKDIPIGRELTYNYSGRRIGKQKLSMSQKDSTQGDEHFACFCGAKNCLKLIPYKRG